MQSPLEKKTKRKHKKTTKNNNNNKRTKKDKNAANCYSLLKSKQLSSVCKPYFFTKHHSKNKRKITGLSIDVSQMARLIKPQSE